MPTLETNSLPIQQILICAGQCGKQGHTIYWCPDEDHYAKCTYIDTPNSGLSHSYALLRECKMLLFNMMTLDDANGIKKMKIIILELKEIILKRELYL